MPAIRSGHVTAFFMYDVADAIDLQAVPSLTTHTVAARLAPRPPTPAYVQYKQPPLSIDGEAIGIAEIAGFRVRFKIFDCEPLSAQERDDVRRHRISYLVNDLVVPTWNAALVYDNEAGAQAAIEILEFANSQLLEFRYYDELLDAELARIYAQLQVTGWFQNWVGRRYTRAARQVHSLFIDVNELTDKTENALKIAGDVYAARLFGLAAARLGLDQWKANVREKLKTLDDIYRFAVEQTSMARGEILELTLSRS